MTSTGDIDMIGGRSVTLLPGGSQTVVFEFDVPESLEGVTAQGFVAGVGVHGINAGSGFIDGQGGSTLSIPYYDDATPEG